MNYNPTTQTTFWFVKNQMMLTQNPHWKPDGENGAEDSIGRSKDAWFAYRDPQFIDGVKKCWKRIDCDPDNEDCSKQDHYYKGQRHPTQKWESKDFSRDHTTNTFVLMKLAGEEEWAKEVASHINWVITEKHVNSKGKMVGRHSFTPALWGWVKNIAGKWWGLPLFYSISFFELLLYWVQNGLIYLAGNFSREYHQDDYDSKTMSNQKQSKWKQFWGKGAYPIYALNLFGWQLFVMNDNPIKRLLQFMAYPLIPRHNYLLKLLFNVGKVSKLDVINYKPMERGRWTTPLNEINDRGVFIINKEEWLEENTLDKDLLVSMWNYRNPKNKII